jgi:hypothetical protein
MYVNRKLNDTPITIAELRPGNILQLFNNDVVVTGIDANSQHIQIESFHKEFEFENKNLPEIYSCNVVDVSKVNGVKLWGTYGDTDTCDSILKSFEFIAVASNNYQLIIEDYDIRFTADYYIENTGMVVILLGSKVKIFKSIWYLHELQNSIYAAIDIDINNSLTKKVMTKNSNNSFLKLNS